MRLLVRNRTRLGVPRSDLLPSFDLRFGKEPEAAYHRFCQQHLPLTTESS